METLEKIVAIYFACLFVVVGVYAYANDVTIITNIDDAPETFMIDHKRIIYWFSMSLSPQPVFNIGNNTQLYVSQEIYDNYNVGDVVNRSDVS